MAAFVAFVANGGSTRQLSRARTDAVLHLARDVGLIGAGEALGVGVGQVAHEPPSRDGGIDLVSSNSNCNTSDDVKCSRFSVPSSLSRDSSGPAARVASKTPEIEGLGVLHLELELTLVFLP